MANLFDHLYSKQHWTNERSVRIKMPFKDMSKTKIVSEYIRLGGDVEALRKSISCYDSLKPQCGRCKPCARKWAALENNNIQTDGLFTANPKQYFTSEIIERAKAMNYRGIDEDTDILKALRLL